MRCIPILCLAAGLLLGSDSGTDPLTLLPTLPRVRAATSASDPALRWQLTHLGQGVHFGAGVVVLDGATIIDQGPRDGLEVLACLDSGKTHEALIRLHAATGEIVKAAFLAALNPPDGQPTTEGSDLPARGTPLRVRVLWQDPDDRTWRIVDGSSLVRDRMIDRQYPTLPYVYTGSHQQLVPLGTDEAGAVQMRPMFMLNNSKTVIANFDESDALLASPFPGAGTDQRFETASNIAPPPKTAVRVVIEAAELPLRLHGATGTALAERPDAAPLDDDALGRLLELHYGAGTAPTHRAVQIHVDRDLPRNVDVLIRERILAIAAQRKAWVVPVFTPSGSASAPAAAP